MNKTQDLLSLIQGSEEIDINQIDELIKSSLELFNDYIEVSKSGDKVKQEEMLKQLLAFKESLEETSKKTAASLGLNPEQFLEVLQDPSNFSEEEQKKMNEINSSLFNFNSSLIEKITPQPTIKKLKKTHKKSHLSV